MGAVNDERTKIRSDARYNISLSCLQGDLNSRDERKTIKNYLQGVGNCLSDYDVQIHGQGHTQMGSLQISIVDHAHHVGVDGIELDI